MSANPYLFNEIQQEFAPTVVRRALHNRTDVACGLAQLALNQQIMMQHRSTRNYGIVTQYEYEEAMGDFDQILGNVFEYSGIRVVPVVEWLLLRVSEWSTTQLQLLALLLRFWCNFPIQLTSLGTTSN